MIDPTEIYQEEEHHYQGFSVDVFECFDIFGLYFTSRFLEISKFSAFENVQKTTFELFSKIQVFGKIKKMLRHESKLQIKQEKVFSKQFLKPLEHLDR